MFPLLPPPFPNQILLLILNPDTSVSTSLVHTPPPPCLTHCIRHLNVPPHLLLHLLFPQMSIPSSPPHKTISQISPTTSFSETHEDTQNMLIMTQKNMHMPHPPSQSPISSTLKVTVEIHPPAHVLLYTPSQHTPFSLFSLLSLLLPCRDACDSLLSEQCPSPDPPPPEPLSHSWNSSPPTSPNTCFYPYHSLIVS